MMRGWGWLRNSYVAIKDLLNEEEPISTSTFEATVRRFEGTGGVNDREPLEVTQLQWKSKQ